MDYGKRLARANIRHHPETEREREGRQVHLVSAPNFPRIPKSVSCSSFKISHNSCEKYISHVSSACGENKTIEHLFCGFFVDFTT